MVPIYVLVCAAAWFACVVAGGVVGARRNAPQGGALAGALLGPLGVVVAFALDGRPQCPRCAGRLDGKGHVCQHCRAALAWPEFGEVPKLREEPAPITAQPSLREREEQEAERWAALGVGMSTARPPQPGPVVDPAYEEALADIRADRRKAEAATPPRKDGR